jgi:hypothetical protein
MARAALNQPHPRFEVRDTTPFVPQPGEAVYRFYELFDWANVPAADSLARTRLEPPHPAHPSTKPLFEEKLLFALLWNRRLQPFWRRELGDPFFAELQKLVPQPGSSTHPAPPHAAIPGLELSDWRELKSLSQRERQLILKVSGFSPTAWGARGVFLGSDLSAADWAKVVDQALDAFPQSPFILQRYAKPESSRRLLRFQPQRTPAHARPRPALPLLLRPRQPMMPRSPGWSAGHHLSGRQKIIHGMRDAILTPCAA